jgi:hypothetical protein
MPADVSSTSSSTTVVDPTGQITVTDVITIPSPTIVTTESLAAVTVYDFLSKITPRPSQTS